MPGVVRPEGTLPEDTARGLPTQLLNVRIMSVTLIAVCFILYFLRTLLIQFVVAVFLYYVFGPVVDWLSKPCEEFGKAGCCRCLGKTRQHGAKDESDADERTALNPAGHGVPPASRPPQDWQEAVRRRCSCEFLSRCCGCLGRDGHWRMPRWLAILAVLCLILGGLILVFAFFISSVTSFNVRYYSTYKHEFESVVGGVLSWAQRTFGLDEEVISRMKLTLPLGDIAKMVAFTTGDLIINLMFVFLFFCYLLWEPHRASSAAGKEPGQEQNPLLLAINERVREYLAIKALLSAIMGMLIWLFFLSSGVHLAFCIGLLTFFMNFIPNVGVLIALVLPAPIILLDPSLSVATKVFCFVIPGIIHFAIPNICEPLFFSQRFTLHPVIILLSLGFWYLLWGIAGAVLAVPITSAMKISLEAWPHAYAQNLVNLFEGKIFAATHNAGGGPVDVQVIKQT